MRLPVLIFDGNLTRLTAVMSDELKGALSKKGCINTPAEIVDVMLGPR